MGGINLQACLHEGCPEWLPGHDCDNAVEVLSTLDPETGDTHRRVVCGHFAGALAAELSEEETLRVITGRNMPSIVDEVVQRS